MASKDDWKVDVKPHETFSTPTFISLFIINRILKHHVLPNQRNASQNNFVLRSLVKPFFDNTTDQDAAFKVLSSLISNTINTYLRYICNESSYSIIDQIFNKIILTKFKTQYHQMITYKNQNQKTKNLSANLNPFEYNQDYMSTVFNINDLMCYIFQFLPSFVNVAQGDVAGDLKQCSLVCGHWLFHAFNPNSTYQFCVRHMLYRILNTKTNKYSCSWQRLTNIKHVDMRLSHPDYIQPPSDYLLSQLLRLGHIEYLECAFHTKHVSILKAIMQQCKDNIKSLCICILDRSLLLPPIKLINIEMLEIQHLYFYIIWSRKCKKLHLDEVKNIDDKWCEFVIDNCDCSGTTHLIFRSIEFVYDSNGEILFPQLAKKFINLKILDIELCCQGIQVIVLFLQTLAPIIKKNNVKISLSTNFKEKDKESNIILNKYLDKTQFNITKMMLACHHDDEIIPLSNIIFKRSSLEYIVIQFILNVQALKVFINRVQDCCNLDTRSRRFMPGLRKIEIGHDSELKDIVNLINLIEKFITIVNKLEQQVFVIANLSIWSWNVAEHCCDGPITLELFKKYCQIIFSILIEQQVAINVNLTMSWGSEKFSTELKQIIFTVWDEKLILSKYKSPKGNLYCIPLATPTWTVQRDIYGSKIFCGNCICKPF